MTATHLGARGVRVEAAGKLNLLLHVLAREASGFHAIESLFVKLALHDVVTIHTDVRTSALRCDGPTMPTGGLGAPESNLAWRAAEEFREATGFPEAWSIAIEKRIPVGGGLGGGSADAAAVLRGLNALAPTPVSLDQLVAMAGRIGSDVPFLVSDAVLAWCWGRGDRLLALPSLSTAEVTLVTSSQGVDTGAAYRLLAAERAAAERGTVERGAAALQYPSTAFSSWSQIAERASNDFETVVPAIHAGVGVGLRQVRAWAAARRASGVPAIGLLSGSGATCYVLAPSGPDQSADPAETPARLSELAAAELQILRTRTAQAIVPPELIF